MELSKSESIDGQYEKPETRTEEGAKFMGCAYSFTLEITSTLLARDCHTTLFATSVRPVASALARDGFGRGSILVAKNCPSLSSGSLRALDFHQ